MLFSEGNTSVKFVCAVISLMQSVLSILLLNLFCGKSGEHSRSSKS